jgi:hypothetical protein
MTVHDVERGRTAPQVRDLPDVPPLGRMVGPGVVAVGIGMAAGEIVIWPYITSLAGFGLLWLAIVTLIMQVVINMEIERYTLATGQTVVAGVSRWWRGWGVLIILGGLFQYAWPGWATSAAAVFSFSVGGNATWVAVISLWVIGALLSASPVVYQTVEKVEFVKVAATIFFLAVVIVAVLTWRTVGDGAAAVFTGFGQIPAEVPFVLMLSGIGAAGAGGVHNLVLSNWIRDKGYGMGKYAPRIVSPISGQEEAAPSGRGYVFRPDERNMSRWRDWWRKANIEQFVSFFVIGAITITVFSLVARATVFEQPGIADADFEFVEIEGNVLKDTVGAWFGTLFWLIGAIALFAAALGIIDYVSRLVADVLLVGYVKDSPRWTESRLYFAVVWGIIAFGVLVLLLGFDQPLTLVVLAAALSGIVMFIYSALLVLINRRFMPEPLKIRGVRLAALVWAFGLFGVLSVIVVIDQFGELF